MSWLDLASTNARTESEKDVVKRLTVKVLQAAGWSEAPTLTRLGGPLTRELDREDFDLPLQCE